MKNWIMNRIEKFKSKQQIEIFNIDITSIKKNDDF